MNISVRYIRTFEVDQQLHTWRMWEKLKLYPTKLTCMKFFFFAENFSTKINKKQ